MNARNMLLRITWVVTLAWALAPSMSASRSLQAEVAALPDVAAPPSGSVVWIAKAMRLNGVPMTMKAFTSTVNADEVLHHYDRALRLGSDTKTRRSHEGSDAVLAIMGRDHYITIRAHNTGKGSEGTIAVSPTLANFTSDKSTRFPLPKTAHVVSLQQYDDDGIEAEHISLISERSPAIEARAYASELAQQGWQLLRSESSALSTGGYVIEAQKAAALAQLNFRHDRAAGTTTILIVWRKA